MENLIRDKCTKREGGRAPVVRYVQVSDDFNALAEIFFAQDSLSPKKSPDDVTDRIRKRVHFLTGTLGVLVTRTMGSEPFPEQADHKKSRVTYYVTQKDVKCYGFIWYPNGKMLPVLAEEIELVRILNDTNTDLVLRGLDAGVFPRSVVL